MSKTEWRPMPEPIHIRAKLKAVRAETTRKPGDRDEPWPKNETQGGDDDDGDHHLGETEERLAELFSQSASANSECGKEFIAGGAQKIMTNSLPLEPHKFPWLAYLVLQANYTFKDVYLCGGSFVSRRWVLTAAHCLEGTTGAAVFAGTHNLTAVEDGRVSIRESVYKTHPGFVIEEAAEEEGGKVTLQKIRNDIALIGLEADLPLGGHIGLVCLPTRAMADVDVVGLRATAAGWGLVKSYPEEGTQIPMYSPDRPIISDGLCHLLFVDSAAESESELNPQRICFDSAAGSEPGPGNAVNICTGDSGGPLTLVTTYEKERRHILFGVASFGKAICELTKYPSVFTDVANYLDWIDSATGIKID